MKLVQLLDHENIAPFVKVTNKFKILEFSKSFQNLKNADIVHILSLINSFYSYFCRANFCILNISHTLTICDLSSLLAYHPILKNYLHPSPLMPILVKSYPHPNKWREETMGPDKGANLVTLQESNSLKR